MSDTRVMWWPTIGNTKSQALHAALVDMGKLPRSYYESLCGRPIGEGRGVTRPTLCGTCRAALRRKATT